jgi:hypothetical protein
MCRTRATHYEHARTGVPPWTFAVAVPVKAFLCFALRHFSCAVCSFCPTGNIVLLLTYGELLEQLVAHGRAVGTLVRRDSRWPDTCICPPHVAVD